MTGMPVNSPWCTCMVLLVFLVVDPIQGGIVKDLYQKITNTNNQTEDTVKQSVPVCGSGLFSTPDEKSLSPELILITNRPVRSDLAHGFSDKRSNRVATEEFRFHVENVTLEDLERHGFNPSAPVTFLIHGFTSGYPLQTWISAMVETYSIDHDTQSGGQGTHHGHQDSRSHHRNQHNLFIINWNYAARGIVYPRAVANIPIVASYVTKFINERLLDEAGVKAAQIQLVGHSLGAHLSGYIGKNTRDKLGRIYGLDPAGPCFGALSGPLFPSSKRLAASDAREVISVHTNSDLLGIDKPLGQYAIFVEGGATQPGCKGGGVLKTISSLTLEGVDSNDLSCSHSRAPNLLTYRLEQYSNDPNQRQGYQQEQCQLVAYECTDWESFINGQCGICDSSRSHRNRRGLFSSSSSGDNPLSPVQCLRIGLDWQYQDSAQSLGSRDQQHHRNHRPTRTPLTENTSRSPYNDQDRHTQNQQTSWTTSNDTNNRRAKQSNTRTTQRNKRQVTVANQTNSNSTGAPKSQSRSWFSRDESSDSDRNSNVESTKMFLRTANNQPYCTYHYQVVLVLDKPFPNKKPGMQIILQDSESRSGRSMQKNSLSSDNFGKQFDELTYSDLLTSGQRLGQVDHATILFRDGLDDGHHVLKRLHINYMSHVDPQVRKHLSSELCVVVVHANDSSRQTNNRYFFEPCNSNHNNSSSYNKNNSNSFDNEDSNSSKYSNSDNNADNNTTNNHNHHNSNNQHTHSNRNSTYIK